MSGMFFNADSFNGVLTSWDISSVTDMSKMFAKADAFNQDLCAWKDNFPYTSASK